jgi:hypothetical protein
MIRRPGYMRSKTTTNPENKSMLRGEPFTEPPEDLQHLSFGLADGKEAIGILNLALCHAARRLNLIRCRNSLISPRSAPTLTGRTMMNLAASWTHLSRATGCHSLR